MPTIADKFNVWCKYQTKNNNEIYMPPNLSQNKQTLGEYFQDINRIRHIGKDKKETSSNDMHFEKQILNVEATGYFKVLQNMDDISVKLRGGHHSNDGKDSARCYVFRVGADGQGKNFAKEYPHRNGDGYTWRTLPVQFNPGPLEGRWVGIKAITWNEGNDKVHCECYLDLDGVDGQGKFDPQRQNWKLWYDVVDEGKDGVYGEDIKDKHETKAVWTTLQNNSSIQFRVDAEDGKTMNYSYKGNDLTFQMLSAREISI
jgi:hypothetical protein